MLRPRLLAAFGKTHAAFDGRCIPAEPRLREALIVAFHHRLLGAAVRAP